MGRSAPTGGMPGGRVGRGSERGAMPGGEAGITCMESGGGQGERIAAGPARGAMPGGRVGRSSARGAMPGGNAGITCMESGGGPGDPCIARLSWGVLLCPDCRDVVCSSGWLGWVGCLANTSKTCSSKVAWTCFALPRMLSGMEMHRLQMDEDRVLRNSV